MPQIIIQIGNIINNPIIKPDPKFVTPSLLYILPKAMYKALASNGDIKSVVIYFVSLFIF